MNPSARLVTWLFPLGAISAAFHVAAAKLRRARERRAARERAAAVYDALRQLDDRTLRDIGYCRSELTSIATRFSGERP